MPPPRIARVPLAMHCERPPKPSERLTEAEIECIVAAASPATPTPPSSDGSPPAEEDPFELDASYGRLMGAPCGEHGGDDVGVEREDVEPPRQQVSLATLLVLCTPLPHILQLPAAFECVMATVFSAPEADMLPTQPPARRSAPPFFPPPRTKPSALARFGARPRQSWRRSTPN
jgi:hypothetical protein